MSLHIEMPSCSSFVRHLEDLPLILGADDASPGAPHTLRIIHMVLLQHWGGEDE